VVGVLVGGGSGAVVLVVVEAVVDVVVSAGTDVDVGAGTVVVGDTSGTPVAGSVTLTSGGVTHGASTVSHVTMDSDGLRVLPLMLGSSSSFSSSGDSEVGTGRR
jgi:hypothetical protein